MHKNKIQKRTTINLQEQFVKIKTRVQDGKFIYTGPMKLEKFAKAIETNANDIIKKMFLKGKMINLNSTLDDETIGELCLEYNLDFSKEMEINAENILEAVVIEDNPQDLQERPPIVTIMGHVDHGKTTLLDTIKQTNISKHEVGGITQKIGVYKISYKKKEIIFLDTPGHEAFTQMRLHGANVTDIIIIVIAANDGVKPQTIEAINHAKNAKVPIIIAINKIDLSNINIEEVKNELSAHDVIGEEWGGDVIFKTISAKNNQGINELLDTILLIAEINEYQANPNQLAIGTIIESWLDKSLGPVATLLIQTGTLNVSDPIVVGSVFGRVRTIKNENNDNLNFAGPSSPVIITGLAKVPKPGFKFMAFTNEKVAKKIAKTREIKLINDQRNHSDGSSIEEFSRKVKEADFKELNIIIKTDTNGSIQAIKNVLGQINIVGTKINIVAATAGTINDSDILLAKIASAIIYGFNTKTPNAIIKKALKSQVKIYHHNVIYHLKNKIEEMIKGLLDPVYEEEKTGQAEVRKVFVIPKVGTIAGCYVINGYVEQGTKGRLLRNNQEIFNGIIKAMKIEKNEVKSAKQGHECGIDLSGFNDIQEGDIIEGYKLKEVAYENKTITK